MHICSGEKIVSMRTGNMHTYVLVKKLFRCGLETHTYVLVKKDYLDMSLQKIISMRTGNTHICSGEKRLSRHAPAKILS